VEPSNNQSIPPPVSLYRLNRLEDSLQKGHLILTPNQRIAAKIKQAWSLQAGNQAINAVPVFALNDWLQQQYQSVSSQVSQSLPHLLNSGESQLIWEHALKVIEHNLLMRDDSIAALLSSADNLLQEWNIDWHTLPNDADSQFLKQGIKQFEEILHDKNFTTPSRAWHQLNQFWQDQIGGPLTTALPPTIRLEGFTDKSPLTVKLLSTLEHNGSRIIEETEASQSSSDCYQFSCPNEEQEFFAAAHWAKQELEKNRSDNQAPSIGIVIPNLNHRRDEVERILQTVFEPQYVLPNVPRYSLPFNISAGTPLAQQPVIACALHLLELNQHSVSLNQLLSLLHLPFWGNETDENELRIGAEIHLRNLQWESLSLAELRKALQYKSENDECSDNSLLNCINHFEQSRAQTKGTQYPSQWHHILQTQLDVLGWPGSRRLDSVEYQQVSIFQEVFDEFMLMDDLIGEINFDLAISTLKRLCQQRIFQPQTPDSPIQVLGLLEAGGLHFDQVWVCGMSELNWPPAPQAHPLLPVDLQRANNMPHCSVEREQHYAHALSNHLIHNSQHCVFSWVAQSEENLVSIAHMFKHFPALPAQANIPEKSSDLQTQHPYKNSLQDSSTQEIIEDSTGSPLASDILKGGQGFIKAQAQNPFDAYMQYRLNIRTLKEPSLGLPKNLRGDLIHLALQFIWQTLKGQTALLQLSDKAAQDLIQESIDFSLRKVRHKSLHNETFRSIEIQQLQQHLSLWLNEEKKRPPFTVIGFEKSLEFQIAEKTLRLRIDRIDQLSDNSLLLIDYKTTARNLSTNDWKDQPPLEPQLPLYTLALQMSEAPVSGIAYAQIDLEKIKFTSLGNHEELPQSSARAPKPLSDDEWQTLQQQWQNSLTLLIEEIKNGEAGVCYKQATPPAYLEDYKAINRWYEKEYLQTLLEGELNSHKEGTDEQ